MLPDGGSHQYLSIFLLSQGDREGAKIQLRSLELIVTGGRDWPDSPAVFCASILALGVVEGGTSVAASNLVLETTAARGRATKERAKRDLSS